MHYKKKRLYFYGAMAVVIFLMVIFILVDQKRVNNNRKTNVADKPMVLLQNNKNRKKQSSKSLIRIKQMKQDDVNKKDMPNPRVVQHINVTKYRALSSGRRLENKTNVPRLTGHFSLPVVRFIYLLQSDGAKLVVYDRNKKKLLGQLKQNSLSKDVDVTGMSVRTRQITRDLSSEQRQAYNQIVKNHFGSVLPEYLMMLPKELDARFWGTLTELLRYRGIALMTVDLIDFNYMEHDNQLYIKVNHVFVKGKKINMNVTTRFI